MLLARDTCCSSGQKGAWGCGQGMEEPLAVLPRAARLRFQPCRLTALHLSFVTDFVGSAIGLSVGIGKALVGTGMADTTWK